MQLGLKTNRPTVFKNPCGEIDEGKDIPAILLLDEKFKSLAPKANVSTRRLTLPMPLKVRQLRAILLKLLTGNSTTATGG